MKSLVLALSVIAVTIGGPLAAQEVSRPTVAGVTNFAQVETTVACAGAITVDALPEIKRLGYASIINLRQATEAGANLDAEAAAAKAAGLRYSHVPFNGQSPDPAAATAFLDAITAAGAEPAFIHCSGGNRAATMWLIKRLAVDHWDVERAVAEAAALGQNSQALRQWAIDFAQANRR